LAWDIVLEALPERATALFFLMDERDAELGLRQPWVSIGADADASDRTRPGSAC
jgi:N-acyl-D-amino-acid deacylase